MDILKEEWHPFCLCYECGYKLGWNGESFCVGQPKFRPQYFCDCCEKELKHEDSKSYTWKQAYAMGLENITWEDIEKVRQTL